MAANVDQNLFSTSSFLSMFILVTGPLYHNLDDFVSSWIPDVANKWMIWRKTAKAQCLYRQKVARQYLLSSG